MRRITRWIARHDMPLHINFDGLRDSLGDENSHIFQQSEFVTFSWMLTAHQLFHYRRAR